MGEISLSEKRGYGEQFDVEGLNFFRRLLAAIQNKEFVVFFQPKISIADMKISGAEALVRWYCDGSVLPPIKFIPFCERTGLVIDVDFYVLEETCKKMREWLDEGLELVRISVNFSKYHFNEPEVAEKIYKVIKKYDIPTEYIEVEFTETAYLDKEDLLEHTVDKLRSYGIKSSIDDFGSGYSSLNLLQNMDFQVVKLDKSLLGKGVENEKAKKVISSIIHMAKELEMEVLAEGVETPEELEMLKRLKCDTVQGFLFDKPLPVSEFEKRLRERNYPHKAKEDIGEKPTVKLNDVDFEEIKVEKKTEEKAEKKAAPQPVSRNRYMDMELDFDEEVSTKKHTGTLIVGVVLILIALTVIGASIFMIKGGKLPFGKKEAEEEKIYTQSQVDAMIEEAVNKNVEDAKAQTEKETYDAFKKKVREASEVSSGMSNFLRSLYPDDLVFIDGSKFLYVPINKDLKQHSYDSAKFKKDEETGYLYYTDDSGNKTSYFGIDVAYTQKDIDWKKVKEAGVEFAIIRCGFRGYGSEGKLVEDTYFEKNIKGAQAQGINVGVYFYTQALDEEEAREEAAFALKTIKPYNITGPVVIDVENASATERVKDLTKEERTSNVIAFCDAVAEAGYKPMIYANTRYFVIKMEIDRLENIDKWYANYNSLEMKEGSSVWEYNDPLMFPYEYKMWQYSETGEIPGIPTGVDLDVLFEKWW